MSKSLRNASAGDIWQVLPWPWDAALFKLSRSSWWSMEINLVNLRFRQVTWPRWTWQTQLSLIEADNNGEHRSGNEPNKGACKRTSASIHFGTFCNSSLDSQRAEQFYNWSLKKGSTQRSECMRTPLFAHTVHQSRDEKKVDSWRLDFETAEKNHGCVWKTAGETSWNTTSHGNPIVCLCSWLWLQFSPLLPSPLTVSLQQPLQLSIAWPGEK